jgi:hypothetical protein
VKRCPKCYRANADEADACVLCNEPLGDIDPTLRFDPLKDEEEWKKSRLLRVKIVKRDTIIAAFIYAMVIDFTVIMLGLDFDPLALFIFFLSGLLVAFAVTWRYAGQFTASLLQGGICITLIVLFNFPLQPLVVFLILGHLVLPSLLYHWIEGIQNMYH